MCVCCVLYWCASVVLAENEMWNRRGGEEGRKRTPDEENGDEVRFEASVWAFS